MRFLAFATRNRKEILRDPLNLAFGIGFPVVLILLISFMKQSVKGMPAELFAIESFAPGMAVFGLSFFSIFVGILIASDRSSSFLMRIFASPLTCADYIIGYSLPLLPIAILQSAVCFITAFFFGLALNINILLALMVIIPVALLFISFGLLFGSIFTYKQVGGISSILINVAAWFSGTWFDLDMIGGTFRTVCYALPFAHAIDAVEAAVAGQYASIMPHLVWVCAYAVVLYIIAIAVFRKKMEG